MTNGDVQKMLGVSRATAMRILQKLDSLLEPVGQGAAEDGDFDIVIISRGGGSDSEEGYGLLEDKNVKTFIANMAKLTICAVGHVNDRRSEESFHYFLILMLEHPVLQG